MRRVMSDLGEELRSWFAEGNRHDLFAQQYIEGWSTEEFDI